VIAVWRIDLVARVGSERVVRVLYPLGIDPPVRPCAPTRSRARAQHLRGSGRRAPRAHPPVTGRANIANIRDGDVAGRSNDTCAQTWTPVASRDSKPSRSQARSPTLQTMGILAAATGTNWDTFVPDMIVGAGTGVAVGLVLLGTQAVAQGRRSRADSQFAWESLKPTVAGAAHRSWIKDLDTLLPIPRPLIALDEIASVSSLALWKSHLRKPDPALEALLVLVRLRPQFESCASELESALERDSTRTVEHVGLGLDSHFLGRVIRARAYSQRDASAFLTIPSGDNLPGYVFAADQLQNFWNEMGGPMTRYREVADRFTKSLDRLNELLASDDL